jgi:hypothetical protein
LFCPTCRTEYIEGITVCDDCQAPLVPELPPETEKMPVTELAKYEKVLVTYNASDIALLKSILDGTNIAYYFLGEFFNYAEPLVQPARLMVKKDQVPDVKELLKEVKLTFSAAFVEKPEEKDED